MHWDVAALRERCQESAPTWDNYSEDIKEQIGAAPAAAWRGEVVEIVLMPTTSAMPFEEAFAIQVTVALEGSWVEIDAAMPLLLREPHGYTLLPDMVAPDGAVCMYRFAAPPDLEIGSLTGAIPWLELRTPRETRRFPLTPEGKWTP